MHYGRFFVTFLTLYPATLAWTSPDIPRRVPPLTSTTRNLARNDGVAPSSPPLLQGIGSFRPLPPRDAPRRVRSLDLLDRGPVPLRSAWAWQQRLRDACLNGDGGDAIIWLQHAPVYTLGRGGDAGHVLCAEDAGGPEVIRVDRGGDVTYHGPGQLTAYPVLQLKEGYAADVHWYVRALEEAAARALRRAGVNDVGREDGITGLWVRGKKVAAVGVGVRRWVTCHGIAVNVERRALQNFSGIVPCGLKGREVGCVNDILDTHMTVKEFTVFMKEAMEEVFQIQLVDDDMLDIGED